MLQVSRTQVPDHWLTTSLKGQTIIDGEDTIKVEHSRYSVQTINKDLYPELLAWSNIIDAQIISSRKTRSSHMPSYQASKSHNVHPKQPPSYSDSELEAERDARRMTMAKEWDFTAFLDPTTRAVGFDYSCLEGLDDLVVYSPRNAFSELCWDEAVRARVDQNTERPYHNSPFPLPPRERVRRHHMLRSPLASSDSESESDSDDCKTYQGEDDDYNPPVVGSGDMAVLHTLGGFSSYNLPDGRDQYFNVDDQLTSFMSIEPHFAIADRKNSVGDFPIPNHTRQRSIPNRIAAFCANIPTKVPFGRSHATTF
jgi:hypothetical protein